MRCKRCKSTEDLTILDGVVICSECINLIVLEWNIKRDELEGVAA